MKLSISLNLNLYKHQYHPSWAKIIIKALALLPTTRTLVIKRKTRATRKRKKLQLVIKAGEGEDLGPQKNNRVCNCYVIDLADIADIIVRKIGMITAENEEY